MGTGVYIGDENGIAQRVVKLYIGDENGVAQEVVKAYIGDENGVAQLCFAGAGAKVELFNMSELDYCVINGVTYNSGVVTLNLAVGTPIEVYLVGSTSNVFKDRKNFIVNSGSEKITDCENLHYVVGGDVLISASIHDGGTAKVRTAQISEDNARCSCFMMDTEDSVGKEVKKGFAYRSGMTWGKFVDSMYNNGHFRVGETGRVYFVPTGNAVKDPSNSGAYVSASDYIIRVHTYE